MSTYLVTGYDENGKRVSQPVESDSADEAMQKAGFVAEDAIHRPDLSGLKEVKSRALSSVETSRGEYGQNQFVGLQTVSVILRVAGLFTAALGLLGVVAFIAFKEEVGPVLGSSVVPLVMLLVSGFLLYALSEAFLALRTIAINSYKR